MWPDRCKDANDVLLNEGKDALTACIESADYYPITGIFDAVTYEDDVIALYETGFQPGLSTGWDAVDVYYTISAGELSVITGIPNHGKSNWLDALCVNLARDAGWVTAFFTPENQPYHRHLATIAEKYLRKPFSDGPSPRMTRKELNDAIGWANTQFRWLLPKEDEEGDWTIDGILTLARACVLRYGVNGLVIDPWNEIEHARPSALTETEYVSQALSKIRHFARQNDVHVWVVAHPTKLLREKDGKYPVPTPYDISGSAHWRNKADNCLTVWRDLSDSDSLVTEIHVSKVRFREVGKVGHCELRFNPAIHSYSDFTEPFEPHSVGLA